MGDDVTLTCHVDGNPAPRVYWRRQGDERVLGRAGELRLRGVTAGQFATYTCSATSVGHGTVSRDVHLLRNGAPIIVSRRRQSAKHGDTASIECLVKAIPPPKTARWTKNGQPLDFSKMPRYTAHGNRQKSTLSKQNYRSPVSRTASFPYRKTHMSTGLGLFSMAHFLPAENSFSISQTGFSRHCFLGTQLIFTLFFWYGFLCVDKKS